MQLHEYIARLNFSNLEVHLEPWQRSMMTLFYENS